MALSISFKTQEKTFPSNGNGFPQTHFYLTNKLVRKPHGFAVQNSSK